MAKLRIPSMGSKCGTQALMLVFAFLAQHLIVAAAPACPPFVTIPTQNLLNGIAQPQPQFVDDVFDGHGCRSTNRLYLKYGSDDSNLCFQCPVSPHRKIKNVTFVAHDNPGEDGGALHLEGSMSAIATSTGTIESCVFLDNRGGRGGGLFAARMTALTVESCFFKGNTAQSSGGALHILLWGSGNDVATIRVSSFLSNTASAMSGGGIYLTHQGWTIETAAIESCFFLGNTAQGHGGAVYVWDNVNLVVGSCSFQSNKGLWNADQGVHINYRSVLASLESSHIFSNGQVIVQSGSEVCPGHNFPAIAGRQEASKCAASTGNKCEPVCLGSATASGTLQCNGGSETPTWVGTSVCTASDITDFNPKTGPPGGNFTMTINGDFSSMVGIPAVTFGDAGWVCANPALTSSTTITCLAPAGAGSPLIQFSAGAAVFQASIPFDYSRPIPSSITYSTSPTLNAAGTFKTRARITGAHFGMPGWDVRANFQLTGGLIAAGVESTTTDDCAVLSPTTIECVLERTEPTGCAAIDPEVQIAVAPAMDVNRIFSMTNFGAASFKAVPGCFAVPTVTSVTPSQGSIRSTLTILGSGFGTGPHNGIFVRVGSAVCRNVTWQSDTRILCGSLGIGIGANVQVTVEVGQQMSTDNVTFSFLDPEVVSISGCGTSTPAKHVQDCRPFVREHLALQISNTVEDQNGIEIVQILVGGRACQRVSAVGNVINCRLASALAGKDQAVALQVGGLAVQSSSSPPTVSFKLPRVDAVSGCPGTLANNGTDGCARSAATQLTLRGEHFGLSSSVIVGDAECVVFEASNTEIRCNLTASNNEGFNRSVIVAVVNQISPPKPLVSFEAIACGVGKHTLQATGNDCRSCAAGKYQANSSAVVYACEFCPSGFRQGATGASNCSACTVCTEGKYTRTTCTAEEDSNCEWCGDCKQGGQYRDSCGGDSPGTCVSCAQNSYLAPEGNCSACSSCGTGRYILHACTATHDVACENCPEGYIQQSSDVHSCPACPEGRFQVGGFHGAQECQDCPAGFFQPSRGSVYCSPCGGGTVQPVAGNTSCWTCEAGKYELLSNQSCVNCPTGFFQASRGSVYCSPCGGGTVQPMAGNTSCLTCVANKYQLPSNQSCVKCPTGFQASTGSVSCDACPSGTIAAPGGTCESCPSGTYIGSSDSVRCHTCSTCSQGKYATSDCTSTQDRACESCPAGYVTRADMRSCDACDVGTFEQRGNCTDCPRGWSQPRGGTQRCVDCAAKTDQVQPQEGQGTCIACSGQQGRTPDAAHVHCMCKQGWYDPNGTTRDCMFCPVGALCCEHLFGPGIIRARTGYWRSPHFKGRVFSCPVASACPGLEAQKCAEIPDAEVRSYNQSTQACLNGHTGLACTLCAPRFKRGTDGICLFCETELDDGSVVVAQLALGWTVVLVISIVVFLCAKDVPANDETQDGTEAAPLMLAQEASVIVSFCQVAASFGYTFSGSSSSGSEQGMVLPPAALAICNWLSVVSVDILAVLPEVASPCTLAASFQANMIVRVLLLPTLTSAVVAGHVMVSKVCRATRDSDKRAWARSKAVQVVNVIVFFLWPSVGTTLVRPFICIDVVETRFNVVETRLVAGDMSMRCSLDDSSYASMVGLSVSGLLVISLGVPIAYYLLLHRHNLEAAHTKLRFGSLYEKYERKYYYWELVVMLYKFIMASVVVILSHLPAVQFVVAFFVAMGYMFIVAKIKPYAEDKVDQLDQLTTVCTVSVLVLGFMNTHAFRGRRLADPLAEARSFEKDMIEGLCAIFLVFACLGCLGFLCHGMVSSGFILPNMKKRRLVQVIPEKAARAKKDTGRRKHRSSIAARQDNRRHLTDEQQSKLIIYEHELEVQASRRQLDLEQQASAARGQRKRFKKRLKHLLNAVVQAFGDMSDKEIVQAIDKDANGHISYAELLECMQHRSESRREENATMRKKCFTAEETKLILKEMDQDRSGTVGVPELLDAIRTAREQNGNRSRDSDKGMKGLEKGGPNSRASAQQDSGGRKNVDVVIEELE